MYKDIFEIFNTPFTFSPNCRSGLVNYIPGGNCNCGRCRKSRGEEVTEQTEQLAKEQAEAADKAYESIIDNLRK